VVGHIHQPTMRSEAFAGRDIRYLNSGDWVEHLTALEFDGEAWRLHGRGDIAPQPVRRRTTIRAAVAA